MASRVREEERESDGPERWTQGKLWPREKWHRCDADLDLAAIYDGRRKGQCREIEIPARGGQRNEELGEYILKHSTVAQHETALPCILSTNYYKAKQSNHTEKTILNRLQSKQLQKPSQAGGAAPSEGQAKQAPRGRPANQQSRYNAGDPERPAALSEHPLTAHPDPGSRPLACSGPQAGANSFLSGAVPIPCNTAPRRSSDSTAALKTESVIRRNRLTLEHVMHERGRHVAEDRALVELHRELRNLEQKEKPQQIITVSRGRANPQH